MNKNILIPLFTLLTSCISDVNDPIVRFWNDGIRPSESKMSEIKKCLDKAYEIYPNEREGYYDRMEYVDSCMKEKSINNNFFYEKIYTHYHKYSYFI